MAATVCSILFECLKTDDKAVQSNCNRLTKFVLPVLSEVLECHMRNLLHNHLLEHVPISIKQWGFLPCRLINTDACLPGSALELKVLGVPTSPLGCPSRLRARSLTVIYWWPHQCPVQQQHESLCWWLPFVQDYLIPFCQHCSLKKVLRDRNVS